MRSWIQQRRADALRFRREAQRLAEGVAVGGGAPPLALHEEVVAYRSRAARAEAEAEAIAQQLESRSKRARRRRRRRHGQT